MTSDENWVMKKKKKKKNQTRPILLWPVQQMIRTNLVNVQLFQLRIKKNPYSLHYWTNRKRQTKLFLQSWNPIKGHFTSACYFRPNKHVRVQKRYDCRHTYSHNFTICSFVELWVVEEKWWVPSRQKVSII